MFLPFDVTVPRTLSARLVALADRARNAGEPLKIAIVSSPSDLGSITSLYGRPTAYARFLSLEIQFVTRAPLLVVMPQGLALARAGKPFSDQRIAGLSVRPGPTGLVETALTSVERLHPELGRGEPQKQSPPSGTTPPPQASSRTALAPGSPPFDTTLPGQPSESLVGAIAGRFERGAGQPVVWIALAITFALVALLAAGVYLADETVRRGGRRTPRR